MQGRRVHAIYIGGGTANLSDPYDIARIVTALRKGFVIEGAELSLEGTPHLFDRLLSSHLENLAIQPTATKRISMGIQTFDAAWLRRMGRERFGDPGCMMSPLRTRMRRAQPQLRSNPALSLERTSRGLPASRVEPCRKVPTFSGWRIHPLRWSGGFRPSGYACLFPSAGKWKWRAYASSP